MQDLSRRHRIDPMDFTRIVMLLVMADAEDDVARATKKARKTGDAAAAERLAIATANREQAGQMQTAVGMALATM